jgi:hypothetical protein
MPCGSGASVLGGKTLTAITTAIVISVLIAKRCWIASLTVLTFSRLSSVHNEVQQAESTVARPERKKKVECADDLQVQNLRLQLELEQYKK